MATTTRVRTFGWVATAAALALAAAGCGSGDDADVASAVGTDAEVEEPDEGTGCSPVGEDLAAEAQETIAITLADYRFDPAMVEVEAGVVTFDVTNDGSERHELAFLPGGGQVPLTQDGEPDEEALADAGAFELESFAAGGTCRATYDLGPGTYTLFCIVTSDDGVTHYDKGMQGRLVVS